MTATELLQIRAEAAMRAEDLRIARKHMVEAAERTDSPANHRAYQRSLSWYDVCKARDEQARSRVIRASLSA